MRTRLILPVKSFGQAKQRLSGVAPSVARRQLSENLATEIIRSNIEMSPVVVSDDTSLREWALSLGAEFLDQASPGLNGAVNDARAALTSTADRIIVAHADLVGAPDFSWLLEYPGITLIPDRRGDGTNVLALPTNIAFRFQYGPHSFRAHWNAAIATGTAVRVVADHQCSIDLDVPADMRLAPARYRAWQ